MSFHFPFPTPLIRWQFSRREKRFFIYGVEDGQTAHCANTGSMKGLLEATHVWVTPYPKDSGRKLLFGAEMLEMPNGTLVGINTGLPNKLAAGAIAAGMVPHLSGDIRHEVKLNPQTRFDLKVGSTWVEVKNVTLAEGNVALFPDAKTERGTKHLRELQTLAEQGESTLQLYIVQRADVTEVRPATGIDPAYAAALKSAATAGVRIMALGCTLTPQGITVTKPLPVILE